MWWKSWICAAVAGGLVAMASPGSASPPATNAPIVVVVEGAGKDEGQARKAALREAVAQAVGSLIDVKTVVRNDRVVKDEVTEFSGGFVKSFDTLAVRPDEPGGVRVRIRATVERLRLFDRPVEEKRNVCELNGSDLLATKQPRAESRRAATALLAHLYADVPKLARAEVKGPPKPSPDGRGLILSITVSADPGRYAAFASRATAILDRVSAAKDGIVLTAGRIAPGHYGYRAAGGRTPHGVFSQPTINDNTPPGHAIWLATPAGEASKLRWALYWVDAEPPSKLDLVGGQPVVRARLEDAAGVAVAENVAPMTSQPSSQWLSPEPWFLGSVSRRDFPTPSARRSTASVFIAPVWSTLNPDATRPEYRPYITIQHKVSVSDADLQRVRRVTATVEFARPGLAR